MKSLKQQIYNIQPIFFKNIMITVYNLRFLKTHRKLYRDYISEYENSFFNLSYDELKKQQEKIFLEKISILKNKNKFYYNLLKNINIETLSDIKNIPLLNKEDLRKEEIKTNINNELFVGYTGGTTGKSLKYWFTKENFIERQACLDFFRGLHGYKFKDKIAWFSGKEIISDKEIKNNIFWVKDYINNITYYSTFHLKDVYIDAMIDNINKTKPDFFSGFPNSIYEIAKRWEKTGKKVEVNLKAIFTTSEPLLEYQKEFLKNFFNCPVPNQYASSEGAPFIYECHEGNLHYDMRSGIIEKLDENSNVSDISVTSFTTDYMPLIRYNIGDKVEYFDSDQKCTCGSNMPIVKNIIGRTASFVYSEDRGKITITNLANAVKYINEIEKFQIIQDSKDEILVNLVCNSKNILEGLEYELRYRLGDKIRINYNFVDDIPNEKNGKYLMIKNSLKV